MRNFLGWLQNPLEALNKKIPELEVAIVQLEKNSGSLLTTLNTEKSAKTLERLRHKLAKSEGRWLKIARQKNPTLQYLAIITPSVPEADRAPITQAEKHIRAQVIGPPPQDIKQVDLAQFVDKAALYSLITNLPRKPGGIVEQNLLRLLSESIPPRMR